MNNKPNDGGDNQLERLEHLTRIFSEAMMQAELAVYRKELVRLTAEIHQTADVHALEEQILRDVAHQANHKFASIADQFPKSGDVASVLARLLEIWKSKHGI